MPFDKKYAEEDQKEIDNIISTHKKIRDKELKKIELENSQLPKKALLNKSELILDLEKSALDKIQLEKSFDQYLGADNFNFPLNHNRTWKMWYKESTYSGRSHRVSATFTIQPRTESAWRDFIYIFTGKAVTRGSGTSSPLVELSMRVLMAIVADFKVVETAKKLGSIIGSEITKNKIKENIHKFAENL